MTKLTLDDTAHLVQATRMACFHLSCSELLDNVSELEASSDVFPLLLVLLWRLKLD